MTFIEGFLYVVAAWFLLVFVRFAWQLACILVPVVIVAAMLHGCVGGGAP